ncbi:MAG: maltose ABC transporter substrate-binding protein [Oliverpabstia sp.]
MKKKAIAAALAVTFAATTLLSGCGDNKTENTKTQDNAVDVTEEDESSAGTNEYQGIPITDEEITLTVWESTAGADEFVIQAGEAFHALYPNISVEYVNVELGDAPGQIALDGPGGVGPDLFAAPSNANGTLVAGGHILPSQNQEYLKEQLLSSCVDAVTLDGEMYGYPLSADTYALFYNKELISEEEVPENFDELVEWCTRFQGENSDKKGFMMDMSAVYYTYIFMTGDGNRIFGENGDDPAAPNVNTKAAVDGYKYMQSLRGLIDAPAADINAAYCDGAFMSGNVAMYITGLWNVANFRDAGIDFGVTTIPCLPGSDVPPASMSNARNMVVSAYTDYPNEAAALALFMVSDEMQKLRFELTGSLPSVNVEVDAEYVAGFLKQLEYAAATPAIAEMNDVWTIMDAASANIWDGADVQKELDAAYQAIMDSQK